MYVSILVRYQSSLQSICILFCNNAFRLKAYEMVGKENGHKRVKFQ